MQQTLARRLQAASPNAVALVTALTFILIAAIDRVTGSELSFSLFYVVPIAMAAFRWGRNAGHLAALVAAAAWMLIGLWSGQAYSHPAIHLWNALVTFGFFTLIVLLLTRLLDAATQARALARTDALTGLPNRRHFEELALRELDRAERFRTPLALAVIDIDDFKSINDHRGHAAGDEALCRFAEVARRELRAVDITARIGGDEFAILLPDISLDDIRSVLERFTAALGSADPTIGCSIGVVHLRGGFLIDALRSADDALYRAKAAGKASIEIVQLPAPAVIERT